MVMSGCRGDGAGGDAAFWLLNVCAVVFWQMLSSCLLGAGSQVEPWCAAFASFFGVNTFVVDFQPAVWFNWMLHQKEAHNWLLDQCLYRGYSWLCPPSDTVSPTMWHLRRRLSLCYDEADRFGLSLTAVQWYQNLTSSMSFWALQLRFPRSRSCSNGGQLWGHE